MKRIEELEIKIKKIREVVPRNPFTEFMCVLPVYRSVYRYWYRCRYRSRYRSQRVHLWRADGRGRSCACAGPLRLGHKHSLHSLSVILRSTQAIPAARACVILLASQRPVSPWR